MAAQFGLLGGVIYICDLYCKHSGPQEGLSAYKEREKEFKKPCCDFKIKESINNRGKYEYCVNLSMLTFGLYSCKCIQIELNCVLGEILDA